MFDQAKIYSNAGSTVHMYNFNLDLEYDWLTTRELTEVIFNRNRIQSQVDFRELDILVNFHIFLALLKTGNIVQSWTDVVHKNGKTI